MCVNTGKSPGFLTLSSFPQAIVHIDCDAFFTSCEESRSPFLRGKPVATGQERGIISCPSYAAKRWGVVRAMTIGEAKKLCPELIVIPSDYELYSIYSQRLFNIVRRFTPQVEEYSIDEAFADLTGLRRLYRTSYDEIAYSIKELIQRELDITVSVGLSLSKTLAKICSKQNKPNGFLAVAGFQLHEFLKDIPLKQVCGFGPNTVALLKKCYVHTVFEYVSRPESFAKKLLGKIGVELWRELRGISVYQVSGEPKEKYLSISKTKTFTPASGNRDFVKAQLTKNLESAFIKLRRHGLSAKILTVYLKKVDFSAQEATARFSRHSQVTLDFISLCGLLFEQLFKEGEFYRATGVILSDIVQKGIDNLTLFDDPLKVEKLDKISQAVDAINAVYGKHTLHIASAHLANTARSSSVVNPLSRNPRSASGRKPQTTQQDGPSSYRLRKGPKVCEGSTKKEKHPRSCTPLRKKELLPGETLRKRLNIPLLSYKIT